MNIVAYCRVSTDKEDQLNSMETQKQFFLEYAEKNNHTLVDVYADEGISGTKKKNRKKFLQLMKDAETGLFEMVVVKDISRLARNTLDFLESIRKLKSLDIETLFLTSNQTILGNSEFVLTMFAALAQEESNNTSKRVKFGKAKNAIMGKVPNLVYGYDKINGDYFNLYKNDFEVSIVQRIFNMYINEGFGANKIAIILNKDGIRTKRGVQWSQNAIIRILTNELYIGKVINKKQEVKDFLTGVRKENSKDEWIVVDKPELAIISEEDFTKAQNILSGRYKAFKMNKERHSNAYPFSTLIKCEHCGYSFRRSVHTYVNTYVRWCCSGRNAKGVDSCPNKTTIDEKELIEEIRVYLLNFIKNKDKMVEHIIKNFNIIYKSKNVPAESEESILSELNKLKKKKSKYTEMFANEIINMQELKEKTTELNENIDRLNIKLSLIKNSVTKEEKLDELIKQFYVDIEEVLTAEVFTNTMLKRIIKKISVNADGEIKVHIREFGRIGVDDTILISDDTCSVSDVGT